MRHMRLGLHTGTGVVLEWSNPHDTVYLCRRYMGFHDVEKWPICRLGEGSDLFLTLLPFFTKMQVAYHDEMSILCLNCV